jgi:hypothetical protein
MLIKDGSATPPADGNQNESTPMVDDCGRPLPASGVGRRALPSARASPARTRAASMTATEINLTAGAVID